MVDEIRDQINDTNWPTVGMPYALMASSSGTDLTIKAAWYGKVDISGTTVTCRYGGQVRSDGRRPDPDHTHSSAGTSANGIEIYDLHKNPNLYLTATSAKLTGGDSATKWRIKIDSASRG